MSKGKSAIDDHRITITTELSYRGNNHHGYIYHWHCGCGKKSGEYENNVTATAEGYKHVKDALAKIS